MLVASTYAMVLEISDDLGQALGGNLITDTNYGDLLRQSQYWERQMQGSASLSGIFPGDQYALEFSLIFLFPQDQNWYSRANCKFSGVWEHA